MDTIVFLSPPLLLMSHRPHASSSAYTTASRHLPPLAAAAASSSSSPRLLIKQQMSSSIIGNNHSTRQRSLLLSSRASAASSASTATAAAALAPAQKEREKDVVFVAGATGRVGSRAVRELIKLGFRVRAAVRNAQRATSLVQSVQQLKLEAQLELVECDLEKQAQEGIVSAIGHASLVVCSIGASEKEILDVTGPYRIDYMATNKLVQAASAAKVEHFILVTSLGTNKIGFPAFLLNLFWGVLYWKRRAEEALIASGIPYTIIRPGGMERPTDAFKETHNLVLAPEDTYVGGQVSNLQVAELIGCIMATNSNRRAAYCKIVEAVAETTAPLLPMEQLLSTIPSKREREPPAADDEPPEDETEAAEVKPSDPKQPEPPAPVAEPSETRTGGKAAEPTLSPYTAYEALKPPSSPSPKQSSSKASQAQAQQMQETAS
ncbi:protein TIC 62, chloroplastic-like isoform X2 [Miscanthus floridulus]|uniref:protein TIC 62, chloroplastic-like isoform X2 n=1 Tax=Miscanthus floridulus TaxID=154761 RepID=UPI00345865B7